MTKGKVRDFVNVLIESLKNDKNWKLVGQQKVLRHEQENFGIVTSIDIDVSTLTEVEVCIDGDMIELSSIEMQKLLRVCHEIRSCMCNSYQVALQNKLSDALKRKEE